MGRPHSGKLYRVQSKRQSFSFVQVTRRASLKRTDTVLVEIHDGP